MRLENIPLKEEILAGRNFSGKKIWRNWRNLIWRMRKKIKFGGNLIWRIPILMEIWREFNLADEQNQSCNQWLESLKICFLQSLSYTTVLKSLPIAPIT